MVCCVCLETISKRHAVTLDCCNNRFCPECLFDWFHRKVSCPLCRAEKFNIYGCVERSRLQREAMFPLRYAIRIAVAGSVLFPILLQLTPAHGPVFVFLIIFSVLA